VSIFTINGADNKQQIFLNKYQLKDNILSLEKGRKLTKYTSLSGYLVLYVVN